MKVKRCISNLCICGRHHCPKKYIKDILHPNPVPDSKLPPSEYIAKYEKFEYAPPKSDQVLVKSDQPMASETIASEAYKFYKVPLQKPHKSIIFNQCPNMIGLSSYKHDYCNSYKKVPPAESFRPKLNYMPNLNPLSDKTIHKESYKLWKNDDIIICRGIPTKPGNNFPNTGKRPFVGITKYSEDFRQHRDVHPIRGKCKEPTLYSSGNHYLDTTYRMDFVKQPIYINLPERKKIKIPKHPPFKSTTVYRIDFREPENIKPSRSCRPELMFKPSQCGISENTVYKKDYAIWPSEERKTPPWAVKKAYVPPKMPISYITTYSQSFRTPCLEFDRLPKKRLPKYMKFENGKIIECEKCNIEDYKNWQPKTPLKMPEIYKTPRQKMLRESIYTTQYRGQFVSPAEIIRPKGNLKITEGKILDSTLYQDSYRCYPSTICPSSLLNTVSPNGKPLFQHVGTTCGHEYYITTNEN